MTTVGNTAALILSADDLIALIREEVARVLRESVDISSFTSSAPRLLSDLKVHSCFFFKQLAFYSESPDAVITLKPPVAIRRRWTTGCCPK